jgi:HK97 gp10 family phage protein
MMDVVADLGIAEARRLVPYDTGATYDSIVSTSGTGSGTFGFRVAGSTVWWTEVGAQTFYAPFLEFGTIYMAPRPFMGPAYDVMTAGLIGSVRAILGAVLSANGGGVGTTPGIGGQVLGDERVGGVFTKYRSFLYSSAKALGDISVFGGRSVFGPLRAQMYGLARLMGDIDSSMNSTIGQRVSNRLQGRVTGRLIGYGSASLSFGKTYSGFIGGAGGHRIYQRFAGQYTKGVAFGSGGNPLQRFFGD